MINSKESACQKLIEYVELFYSDKEKTHIIEEISLGHIKSVYIQLERDDFLRKIDSDDLADMTFFLM
jgi:hypothetical protein